MKHEFGGHWTERKLACLRDYIQAWLKVMSKQKFRRWYIDAFSGTGERHQKLEVGENTLQLSELCEARYFFDGSAKIAISFNPGFDHHILIEQHRARFDALKTLGGAYPTKSIAFRNEDGNAAARDVCQNLRRTSGTRAVMFLDPYGCQVDWATVEEIARTRTIDLWYLFPTGAVLRLLPHDRTRQRAEWATRLTILLGTDEWQEQFYLMDDTPTLFDMGDRFERKATPDTIEEFVRSRLRSVFPAVARSCLRLTNDQGFPNFSLFFAAGAAMERGGGIALRIAEDLIKKGNR